MTRQIPDTVIYKGGEYVLAGLKGKGLLTPTDLNIVTKGLATACYRGYYCQYSCIDNFLFLTELSVFNEPNQLPSLQGIVPSAILDMFARYQDLKIQCPFSGGLVIVKNLVAPNRTLPSPLEYNEVVEIIFEQGMLQGEIDYSSKVNMFRNILDEMWGKLANLMCKFNSEQVWQSSNTSLAGIEHKRRPPEYGSRISASNAKSDARDLEPRLV